MSRAIVFLGPTLPRDAARAILDADYRPPAKKGDVYRCLTSGADTLVLIDGVFHTEPSVWHRELLQALDEGMRVVGASSMGALRAAELHTHGMIGCGTIFEWYRDGVIDRDDEVALLFGPEESGWRALSEPLVNLRHSLACARDAGRIDAAEAARLLDEGRRTFYPFRAFPRLRGLERIDLKRRDAELALRMVATAAVPALPSRRAQRPYQREALLHRPGGAELLARAADPKTWEAVGPELLRRWYLVAWAAERGHRCPDAARAAFTALFEEEERVVERGAWLRARGVTAMEYAAWLDESALQAWLRARGPAAFGLPDGGGDPDAPFLEDWARALGIRLPAARLLAEGPWRFGFTIDMAPLVARELQLRGAAGAREAA